MASVSEESKRRFEQFLMQEAEEDKLITDSQDRWDDKLPHNYLLERDPMSPHDLPHSRVYKSLEDIINYHPFYAVYPQSYAPLSIYDQMYGTKPAFDPNEDDDYTLGVISIKGMIDLFESDDNFELTYKEDYDRILALTNKYINELEDRRDMKRKSSNTELVYLNKLKRFITEMTKRKDRAFKYKNPHYGEVKKDFWESYFNNASSTQ